MKKSVFLLIFVLLVAACTKNNSKTDLQDTSNYSADNKSVLSENEVKSKSEKMVAPEKNPRKALEQLGFWNKQYYKLEYNPLYGYCYQHLFPSMDTSQEKDVIAFHVSSLDDPMLIFVMEKVSYNSGTYELSGKINNKNSIMYVKMQDGKTINVMLPEYDINKSFDLASGIAYSSFSETFNNQEEPVFDLAAYDTCEELDKKILEDISYKLVDDKVQAQIGVNVKTDKGYDCWGKWTSIDDMKNVYYELNKDKMQFLDYTDLLYATENEKAKVRVNNIENLAYKNGIFYFNFEASELIGYMCLPIDNNSSMWVFDDVNLGLFEKIQ